MNDRFSVRALPLNKKRAMLSLDLEYDYGGEGILALNRFENFVEWLRRQNLALTTFVEGRALKSAPGLLDALSEPHVNAAQHCLDHRNPGDTRDDLKKGRDLFGELFGRHPNGYRAHTFQHSTELIKQLIDLEYSWDSSYLPARFGFGARMDGALESVRKNNSILVYSCKKTGRELMELPVGALGRGLAPFTQSYQLILGHRTSALVERIFGISYPFVHDMHMVDLYRATQSLQTGAIPASARALFRLSWRGGKMDSLDILKDFIDRTSERGVEWCSVGDLLGDAKDDR